MATITVLITAGTQWTVPSDYGLPSTVDCLGSGDFGTSSGGGGGGEWQRKNNLALTPGQIVPVQIGGNNTAGSGDTWFQTSAIVLAKGAVGTAPGAGGIGDVGHPGGAGGTVISPSTGFGAGAGGAGGPNGPGVNGGIGDPTYGGAGDNGASGANGGQGGANGSPGHAYGTSGPGGGGCGSLYFTHGGYFLVGNGGQYGGGGGGQAVGVHGPGGPFGTASQGAIWVTYTQSAGPPPTGLHRRTGVSVSG